MSQTVNQHEATAESLQALYGPIQDELAEVDRILRDQLRSDYPFVDELVRYGCLLGGKRLRPALLLLSGKATGQIGHEHVVLATVVEMIHTATLIHDDVLDGADQRRHLATVNARWNNESSVLLGDFLFSHSFCLANTLDNAMASRLIGQTTNIVCEGELRQIGSRGDFSLGEAEYLAIIEAKTAELCACCCRLGALCAHADAETVQSLSRFGRNLGIAFQIADDLLDIQGDESATGKSLGTDLEKRKPTLPLIRVLELADEAERRELLNLLTADGPIGNDVLAPWFERCDALHYAHQRALEFAERARGQLVGLPPSPAQRVLQRLTEFVVRRSQ